MENIEIQNECLCGCGVKISSQRLFISGHNSRVPSFTGGQFKKGNKPWCFGLAKENDARLKNISEKSRQKAIGNKYALGHKYCPKEELRQRYRKEYTGEGNPFFGKTHTEEIKKKLALSTSLTHSGEKHWNWQNWKSKEHYGLDWNEELKEEIRKITACQCFICKVEQLDLQKSLVVHHIDSNKKNSSEDNLVPLCISCHIKVHRRKINLSEEWKEFKNKKFKEIN